MRTSLVAAVLIVIAAGCSEVESATGDPDAGTGATAQPVEVTVAPVTIDTAQRTVDVVGTLFADEEATISAKVSGRIVAVYHDVGDRVQPGRPLAQIERRDYELARSQKELAVRESLAKLGLSEFPQDDLDPETIPTVRKARLGAENAEGRYLRGKQLFDQQPPRMSEQEFADLRTAWEVAQNEFQVQVLTAQSVLAEARARQAELEMAEQQLTDTTVLAPAAATTQSASTTPSFGTNDPTREYAVAERMVSVGEFVTNGTPLFRLIDDDPIKLRAAVPERFADLVQVGQAVRVRVEAFEDPFTGRITRINPQVDPTNRNFQIEAVIENPSHKLKPGAFARASIETHREPNVIFVPRSAVVSFAGVNRVFVVGEDGNAAERRVEPGPERGDEVEIRDGLEGNEQIVIESAGQLSPGTPLQIQRAAPEPSPR